MMEVLNPYPYEDPLSPGEEKSYMADYVELLGEDETISEIVSIEINSLAQTLGVAKPVGRTPQIVASPSTGRAASAIVYWLSIDESYLNNSAYVFNGFYAEIRIKVETTLGNKLANTVVVHCRKK